MNDGVRAIPAGYSTVTAYLVVADCAAALRFYTEIFGGVERMRLPMPGNRIGHAEIVIGGSVVMLADEVPEMGARSPAHYGGSPVSLLLYAENVDDVMARAVQAGATLLRPIENKFYGDRAGSVVDPFGHTWHIATHVEDVTADEMERRMQALASPAT